MTSTANGLKSLHGRQIQIAHTGEIASNDLLTPVDSIQVTSDIRALAVTSRLLAGAAEIPLGEAATVIVQTIKELPEELRSAVIVEFFDFPKTLTLEILGDITIPVLPFFDNYMAEPSAGMTDFTVFANLNYFGVSLDLESSGAAGDDAVADMTAFWAEATNRRLKVLLQGVKEQGLADKAIQYECFALDGPLIGEDSQTMD